MPPVLVVVVVVAVLLWLFMSYFPLDEPVKRFVFAVVYGLLVLWVLGVSLPPLFHNSRL